MRGAGTVGSVRDRCGFSVLAGRRALPVGAPIVRAAALAVAAIAYPMPAGAQAGPPARNAAGASAVPAVAAVAQPPAGNPVAMVLNSRDASVSFIDMRSYTETGRLSVGKEPHHLYPTPDGRSLIIANAVSNDLHLLDPVTGKLQRRIRNIDDPYQIAYSPDRKWFAANALRLDRVDLYRADGAEFTLARRIPLPKAPSHLWFTGDSRHVFVTLQESDEIAMIDVDQQAVVWKAPVGRQPAGLMLTPDDRYLLVGVMGQDYVQVIDWRNRRMVKRIATGKGAHNFRGLGDGVHVFVTNRADNTISKIDMMRLEVVDTIPVPGGPDCIEVTADRSQLWVTMRWAKQVAVVDLQQRKVIRRIDVGRSPHGIYFHDRAPLL